MQFYNLITEIKELKKNQYKMNDILLSVPERAELEFATRIIF